MRDLQPIKAAMVYFGASFVCRRIGIYGRRSFPDALLFPAYLGCVSVVVELVLMSADVPRLSPDVLPVAWVDGSRSCL
jgi:hypothetical protein